MPLCIFDKLFARHITTDDRSTILYPCDTRLTAYNGSNIPQFGALDTAIEWTPKGHQCSKCSQTRWYVADSPGPGILGIPSSSKLGIVQLNHAVKLTSRHDTPVHLRNLQQNVIRVGVTSFLHSTPAKTSSRPILASLRVLVDSLNLITSLYVIMTNLWHMHPENV